MKKSLHRDSLLLLFLLLCSFSPSPKKSVTLYLIGDSTMANYADNYEEGKDYFKTRYPVTGWGQVFQEFFDGADLAAFINIFRADQVVVDDRARGGRSTRTFFEEGRWRAVYRQHEAYPDGQSDNTHFQPEGAKVVAGLVFEALKTVKRNY